MGPRQEEGRGARMAEGPWRAESSEEQLEGVCWWPHCSVARSPVICESVPVSHTWTRDIGENQETGALTFGLPGMGLQGSQELKGSESSRRSHGKEELQRQARGDGPPP